MNDNQLKDIITQFKDAYGEHGLRFSLVPGYVVILMDLEINEVANEVIPAFVNDCLGLKTEFDTTDEFLMYKDKHAAGISIPRK